MNDLGKVDTDAVNVRTVVSNETGLKVIRNDFLEQCPFCGSGTGRNGTSAFSFHSNGYKCFSCDQTGDAVRFIERYHRMSIGDAVQYYKGKYLNQDSSYDNVQMLKDHIRKSKVDSEKYDVMSAWAIHSFSDDFTDDDFVKYLTDRFDRNKVMYVLNSYMVKTSTGGTLFPYVDDKGDMRTIKMIKYLPDTCKRDRSQFPFYLHKQIEGENFNYRRCLFGQHLIEGANSIGVVESEKTAIVCALTIPDTLFLATGGKNVLSVNDIQSIKSLYGKKITLFPDHDTPDKRGMTAFAQWSYVALELKNKGFDITIDDTLESGKYPFGCDLADLILDNIKVNEPEIENTEVDLVEVEHPVVENKADVSKITSRISEDNIRLESYVKSQNETNDRKERLEVIKVKLESLNIPEEHVVMDPSVILDAGRFITSHMSAIEIKIDSDLSEPFLQRLEKFIAILENNF